MGSSFEDLVARDLMVKTDLQSDFSFKRYNILKTENPKRFSNACMR